MLKEAIEKLVSLKDNKIYTIGDRTYSDNRLWEVVAPVARPVELGVSSLESIATLIINEFAPRGTMTFVQVVSPDKVRVFTELLKDESRNSVYEAVSDTPEFHFGWRDYESAMIAFRSQFEQGEDIKYILDLLSRVTDEESVASSDNGLSQTVEVKKGVALKAIENIRPRVKLRPFRTFLEVEQPESEFLLRLNDNGQIGLFEADGGMWTLEAKANIKAYLTLVLRDLINVIVMM